MANEIQQLLTSQIVWAITAFGAAAVAAAVTYGISQYLVIKNSVSRDKWEQFKAYLAQLVLSAEQLGVTGKLEELAMSKKEWVIAEAQAWLAGKGLGFVDLNVIENLIEAYVNEFKNTLWAKIQEAEA